MSQFNTHTHKHTHINMYGATVVVSSKIQSIEKLIFPPPPYLIELGSSIYRNTLLLFHKNELPDQ